MIMMWVLLSFYSLPGLPLLRPSLAPPWFLWLVGLLFFLAAGEGGLRSSGVMISTGDPSVAKLSLEVEIVFPARSESWVMT